MSSEEKNVLNIQNTENLKDKNDYGSATTGVASVLNGLLSYFKFQPITYYRFPDTVDECNKLLSLVQFKEDYFSFGEKSNKFSVHSATLQLFRENPEIVLEEVNLSLPRTSLPNIKGKSGAEILKLYTASAVGHSEVLGALRRYKIDFVVVSLTNDIFVENCEWKTLCKLSYIVDEVNIDLKVSGGKMGQYCNFNFENTTLCESESNEHDDTHNSRRINVGIIDSGCSLHLRSEIGEDCMHKRMFVPTRITNSRKIGIKEDVYDDPYISFSSWGHGTGVVETFLKQKPSKASIKIVSIGSKIRSSYVIVAFAQLLLLSVDIINCSFAMPHLEALTNLLNLLHSCGVTIVGAAGNKTPNFDNSGLNNGKTIVVGSHNNKNVISKFSVGDCKVDVCSRGENIYLKYIEPNIRSGTSFAAPIVTAALVNLLASSDTHRSPNSMRQHMRKITKNVTCDCPRHHINAKTNLNSLNLSNSSEMTNDW